MLYISPDVKRWEVSKYYGWKITENSMRIVFSVPDKPDCSWSAVRQLPFGVRHWTCHQSVILNSVSGSCIKFKVIEPTENWVLKNCSGHRFKTYVLKSRMADQSDSDISDYGNTVQKQMDGVMRWMGLNQMRAVVNEFWVQENLRRRNFFLHPPVSVSVRTSVTIDSIQNVKSYHPEIPDKGRYQIPAPIMISFKLTRSISARSAIVMWSTTELMLSLSFSQRW